MLKRWMFMDASSHELAQAFYFLRQFAAICPGRPHVKQMGPPSPPRTPPGFPQLIEPSSESRRKLRQRLMLVMVLLMLMQMLSLPFILAASILASSLVLPSPRGDRGFG